jgi:predicted metal-dependent hydrolase
MQLWLWHMAEEFEHRSVVHDVLERLYGKDEAFALRKQGADFGRAHFGGQSAQAMVYIREIDRAGMSPGELEASLAREQQVYLTIGAASAQSMLWVYEPDYDPATIVAPRNYETILARYS